MPRTSHASVAAEAPRAPAPPVAAVSFVIPARDAGATLRETLASIRGLHGHDGVEVIVVDDGSEDATPGIARDAGARVLPCEGRGVADARNTGARHARGDIVFFVDADVILPPDALALVRDRIGTDGYAAVTGRLSAVHRFPGFASQYKNLWMAYTYEVLPDDVSLFYTSAAAVRRDVFLELGGFAWRFDRPSVEDTAFGQLLGDRGHRVRAEKRLAVEHLKRYGLAGVLAVDFARARDLTRVFRTRLRSMARRGNTSSVPTSFMLSVPLPVLALASFVAGIAGEAPALIAAALGLLVLFWGCNGGFLLYLLGRRGTGFFLKSHLFLVADAMVVCAGIAVGLVRIRP